MYGRAYLSILVRGNFCFVRARCCRSVSKDGHDGSNSNCAHNFSMLLHETYAGYGSRWRVLSRVGKVITCSYLRRAPSINERASGLSNVIKLTHRRRHLIAGAEQGDEDTAEVIRCKCVRRHVEVEHQLGSTGSLVCELYWTEHTEHSEDMLV